MQKITPFLWFNTEAEEAANYYVSIFKNSSVGAISRYDEASAKASGMPSGSAMVVSFNLDGQEFAAMNGGPTFKFNEAVSFVVNCDGAEEVDHFWNALTEGGAAGQCGWLKDKYGMSWQVVPKQLSELLSDPDKEKASRVMQALMAMSKIDVAELQAAAEEK
jgi:predicted 3-demethylubiquinone-9 3-methyltransferase (glyoxalase superfamily)